MSVKKNHSIRTQYSEFSKGYDLATLALLRAGKPKDFGFNVLLKQGDYLPASHADQSHDYHAHEPQNRQGGFGSTAEELIDALKAKLAIK